LLKPKSDTCTCIEHSSIGDRPNDPAGNKFEEIARLYAERATSLSEIARTGDADAFKAQWTLVRETCSSCHNRFRRDRRNEAQQQN